MFIFRLDSVYMEKNRVGFGSIGPNGGVSLLPFRCFPCSEGEMDLIEGLQA